MATINNPSVAIESFFDFLFDDKSDIKGSYAPTLKRWKLTGTISFSINTNYLLRLYSQFCHYYRTASQQPEPTPHVFPDEDSFIDEVLSLSTTITYDYYTKRVTLPPFNVLVKDIKGDNDE